MLQTYSGGCFSALLMNKKQQQQQQKQPTNKQAKNPSHCL